MGVIFQPHDLIENKESHFLIFTPEGIYTVTKIRIIATFKMVLNKNFKGNLCFKINLPNHQPMFIRINLPNHPQTKRNIRIITKHLTCARHCCILPALNYATITLFFPCFIVTRIRRQSEAW